MAVHISGYRSSIAPLADVPTCRDDIPCVERAALSTGAGLVHYYYLILGTDDNDRTSNAYKIAMADSDPSVDHLHAVQAESNEVTDAVCVCAGFSPS